MELQKNIPGPTPWGFSLEGPKTLRKKKIIFPLRDRKKKKGKVFKQDFIWGGV